MPKVSYNKTIRFFTFRFLWKTSNSLRDQISSTDRDPTHFEYSAYLTLYFTLESYLNYLGGTVYPEKWGNEKDFFSNDKYRGTVGKLKWLTEQFGISQ